MALVFNSKAARIRMIELEISSVVELAQQAKVHKNTVYDMLRGDSFNTETLDKVASALRMRSIDLVQEREKGQNG